MKHQHYRGQPNRRSDPLMKPGTPRLNLFTTSTGESCHETVTGRSFLTHNTVELKRGRLVTKAVCGFIHISASNAKCVDQHALVGWGLAGRETYGTAIDRVPQLRD
jgi:hypothetical protein